MRRIRECCESDPAARAPIFSHTYPAPNLQSRQIDAPPCIFVTVSQSTSFFLTASPPRSDTYILNLQFQSGLNTIDFYTDTKDTYCNSSSTMEWTMEMCVAKHI